MQIQSMSKNHDRLHQIAQSPLGMDLEVKFVSAEGEPTRVK